MHEGFADSIGSVSTAQMDAQSYLSLYSNQADLNTLNVPASLLCFIYVGFR